MQLGCEKKKSFILLIDSNTVVEGGAFSQPTTNTNVYTKSSVNIPVILDMKYEISVPICSTVQ